MKHIKIIFSAALLVLSSAVVAQDAKKSSMTATRRSERVSPLKTVSASLADLQMSIEYSSPAVKGRTIWGELVPYGKIWRTGANEATTIEFNRDVLVNGNRLRAGKYALFTIPGEQEWTVMLNTAPDQWGAFKYDEAKDALRFTVKPEKASSFNERLTFEVKNDEQKKAITVTLLWENLTISWEVK
jgi:hypothetical protein